ncbi:CYTH and CHAD domain-containing protein [Cryobacterium sp. TMT1-3]|uniref:CYTH and CHAD domain-containing protein n=1 Tax=Cryobacterium sp. TMT1-3 TaxID=1259237 RepID=UPI00106D7DE4|nr:CYTH and CHAD domain-containing protein [Cryobacterium sp. TMT1-3]TFC25568.1 CYTH and CHAD domain-containing protein [Cryobacterium sp. TMT1-3]
MEANGGIEIERKFDVDELAVLPGLTELPGVHAVAEPMIHDLEAVYFDTSDLRLTVAHITLRRRTGGDDAGWHLKLPQGGGRRREVHAPLGKHSQDEADAVPESLAQLVRVYVRDSPLIPVARLNTTRVVRALVGAGGETLAVFCDDRVQAERLGHEPASAAWREWELELVDAPEDLLDAAQAVLASAGILVSQHPSKLARTLGGRFPATPAPNRKRPTPTRPAATVLLASLREQISVIRTQDPEIRQQRAGSVHAMRVATRRLRSVLATYESLVDPAVVQHLRTELGWLAAVLGGARDEEVLHHRLASLLDHEAPALLLGPIRERLETRSGTDAGSAGRILVAALDSGRYFRLLDALEDLEVPDALVATPLFTAAAGQDARVVVPALLKKEWKKLRSAVRHAAKTVPGPERDLALHAVRKRAKRLRYAAETAHPLNPERAARVSGFAQKLQTILGDQHDSVIARDRLLQRGGVEAYLRGENTFSYGRLHALEQLRAADAEAHFWKAWSRRA